MAGQPSNYSRRSFLFHLGIYVKLNQFFINDYRIAQRVL